jgi:hypothetical protein
VEDQHVASPREQTSRSVKHNTNSTGSTASINSSLPPNQPVGYLSRSQQEADSKRGPPSRIKVEMADVTELDTSVGSTEKQLPQTRSFNENQATAAAAPLKPTHNRLEMRSVIYFVFFLIRFQ